MDCGFLRVLQLLRDSGAADVVLGCDTEAPPLPGPASMQLGLLDVLANLQVGISQCCSSHAFVPGVTSVIPLIYRSVSSSS